MEGYVHLGPKKIRTKAPVKPLWVASPPLRRSRRHVLARVTRRITLAQRALAGGDDKGGRSLDMALASI